MQTHTSRINQYNIKKDTYKRIGTGSNNVLRNGNRFGIEKHIKKNGKDILANWVKKKYRMHKLIILCTNFP